MRIVALLFALAPACLAANDPALEAAQDAAKWLVTTPAPANDNSLYAGTPGPALFFLELYRYTKEQRYLSAARTRADMLLGAIDSEQGAGLYEGLAGIGFTLGEAYLVTGDAKYREGTSRCVEVLSKRVQQAGGGIQWNDTTDIISGASGTGLFLLWAAEQFHLPQARELAIRTGERLLERGRPAGERKLLWMMDSKFPREMPNFSHGTAGVAYFLATLYRTTHDRRFLDAALAGAAYLLSIADTAGEACKIYHDNENKKLYYLSWCHGPGGTARLFYRLYQITKDPNWLDWMNKSATAMLAAGAPEHVVVPGEWNNISVCCGVTGQAQFFLDMYQVTKNEKYRLAAERATALLLSKATRDEKGIRWVQAETRVRPSVEAAQTGFMQGGAGVGMWLLHWSAFQNHSRQAVIVFPDNPFVY